MTTEEKGRKIVLIIENANLDLKRILNAIMLYPNVNRVEAKALMDGLIDRVRKEFREVGADIEIIESTIDALKMRFLKQYEVIVGLYKKLANTTNNNKYIEVKLQALALKGKDRPNPLEYYPVLNKQFNFATTEFRDDIGYMVTGSKVGRLEVTNIRDFLTEYEEASEGYYINYPEAVRNEMSRIQEEITSGNLEENGASIRLRAELNTRYQLIQEDLARIGKGGFVVSTQHANASERCSWWQGKLFLIDFDVEARQMTEYKGASIVRPLVNPIGYVDGKPYYSLKTACENGFLSYNCQHRLVRYERGMYMPKPYDMVQVDRRRNLSQRQRYLEREIRNAKTDELVLNGVDRKKAIERSQKYQAMYRDFCEDNNLPRYQWRTQVVF